MKILYSFLAIGGGFLTMAALVAVTTFVLSKMAPDFVGDTDKPGLAYMLFNLVYSALFAAAGGYVTAWIAKGGGALIHTLALALVVLLMSALSALQLKGKQPIGYQLTLTALTPLGVFAGGMLRLKQSGLL
jgi:hypothetical protein